MWLMRTMALFTTIPMSTIMPIMVMLSQGWSATFMTRATPSSANGTENMMVNGWVKLSNSAASSM